MSAKVQRSDKVENILVLVAAASRAFTFYPDGHDIPASFTENLTNTFQRFLEEKGPLMITTKRDGFIIDGEELQEDKATLNRMANHLIAIKVVRLDFLPGIEKSEVKAFCKALSEGAEDILRRGGLKKLVGQEGSPHIKVEELIAPEADAAPPQTQEPSDDGGRYPYQFCPLPLKGQEQRGGGGDGKAARTHTKKSSIAEIAKAASQVSDITQTLTEADSQMLAAGATEDIALILSNLLFQEQDKQRFQETGKILADTLIDLATFDNCQAVIEILGRLDRLRDQPDPRTWAGDKLVLIFRRVGKDPAVRSLVSYLATQDSDVDTPKTLMLLGRDAFTQAIEMLAEEEQIQRRRQLLALLVKAGSGNLHLLKTYLGDERWYVVRNIVDIVGKVGGKKAVPYLAQPLRHPHPKVRVSCLRALFNIKGKEAANTITNYLKTEVDIRLRKTAVNLLGDLRARQAVSALHQIIEDRNFSTVSQELKKAAIKALGRIGTAEALAIIEDVAYGRHLFHRRKWRQLKNLAAGFLRHAQSRGNLDHDNHRPKEPETHA